MAQVGREESTEVEAVNGVSLRDIRVEMTPLFPLVGSRKHFGVKVTHIPSGLWGFCGEFKSQALNREYAMYRLMQLLELKEEMS